MAEPVKSGGVNALANALKGNPLTGGSSASNAISQAAKTVAAGVNATASGTSSSSGSGYSSGGSSGGSAAAPVSELNVSLASVKKPEPHKVKKPAALPKNATDAQKATYWMQYKQYYNAEAEYQLALYNYYKRELAVLETKYPNYTQDSKQAQEILNMRQKVADYQNAYDAAKAKADTIQVSVGVSESKDGDKVTVEKTYTITDANGKTVSTKYTEDNGGMTQSELRAKQQADMEKALSASNAYVQAEARRQAEELQAGAERDYAINASQSALDAYLAQYDQNLNKVEEDFSADQLEQNQDLLLASNETQSNLVKNKEQAASILSQYGLGGSSLEGRLDQIANQSANDANQVAALNYNLGMREADRNYGDARLQLENERGQQENANNQAKAQAQADYWARLAAAAGGNTEVLSQYANPDYWLGTMFDAQGNRLNSFEDMNSAAMQKYAKDQASKYQGYQNAYNQQQQQAAANQTNTVADQYTSDYSVAPQQTYQTGLRSYSTVNSNRKLSADEGLQSLTPPTLGDTESTERKENEL